MKKIFFLIYSIFFLGDLCARLPIHIQRKKDFERINPMTVLLRDLSDGFCLPCHGGVKPLNSQEQEHLLQQIDGWKIDRSSSVNRLVKKITFYGFDELLEFVNNLVPIAEGEKHHPDLHIYFNKLKIELYTHAINGLSLSDYVLASKIDKMKIKKSDKNVAKPKSTLGWNRVLGKAEVAERIRRIRYWDFKESSDYIIFRKTIWKNFIDSMRFINILARYLNQIKYFPDISIFYHRVNIEICGNSNNSQLRDLDIIAAQGINQVITLAKHVLVGKSC